MLAGFRLLGLLHAHAPNKLILIRAHSSMLCFVCGRRSLTAGQSHRSTRTLGTFNRAPPELLRSGRLSPACDVYAFGVMIWELFTGDVAFSGRALLRPAASYTAVLVVVSLSYACVWCHDVWGLFTDDVAYSNRALLRSAAASHSSQCGGQSGIHLLVPGGTWQLFTGRQGCN